MERITGVPAREGSSLGRAINVLLVEDNPGDERLIRIALADGDGRDYRVTAVKTLAEAVRLVQTVPYDAVLLDLHLPDSAGLATVKQLALVATRAAIVVTTGMDDGLLAIEVCQHGAEAYIVKGKSQSEPLAFTIRSAIARKQFEAELAQMAYFDSLTGLANRGLFNDRLAHALARGRRNHQRIGVLFIDLDNFKSVNDSFGHKVGDDVLRAVADAIRATVRQTDTVARLGGDEFVVLVEPLDTVNDADLIAKKLLSAVHVQISLERARVRLTASIGIAVFPDDADRADELIHSADEGMFLAKRCGGNQFKFSPENL